MLYFAAIIEERPTPNRPEKHVIIPNIRETLKRIEKDPSGNRKKNFHS